MRALSISAAVSLNTSAAQAALNLLGASDTNPPVFIGEPVLSVTCTIASPMVATIAAPQVLAGLVNNLPVQLYITGGGTMPTGFVAGTTYYTVAVNAGAGTFELAATIGGAAINSTGSAVNVVANFLAVNTGAGASTGYSQGAQFPVTVPIASPGVFTGGYLPNGTPVVLTLNPAVAGAILPTGFTAGTQYFVVVANQQAGSFELSATLGGGGINATGQAGVGVIATALVATALYAIAGPGSPFLPGYSGVLALGSTASAATTTFLVEGADDTMNPPGTPGPYRTLASIVGIASGMTYTEVKSLPQYVRSRVINGGADTGAGSASLLGT